MGSAQKATRLVIIDSKQGGQKGDFDVINDDQDRVPYKYYRSYNQFQKNQSLKQQELPCILIRQRQAAGVQKQQKNRKRKEMRQARRLARQSKKQQEEQKQLEWLQGKVSIQSQLAVSLIKQFSPQRHAKSKEFQIQQQIDKITIQERMQKDSVVAKKFKTIHALKDQFEEIKQQKQISETNKLIRQRLIQYVRKNSLQKLVIFLYVDDVNDFRIPQYEQPYITMVHNDLIIIKNHLKIQLKLMKSQSKRSPLFNLNLRIKAPVQNFQFRRLVNNMFRRTVVMIMLNKKQAKKQQKIGIQVQKSVSIIINQKDNNKQKKDDQQVKWKQQLEKQITYAIMQFNENKFKQSLMSNFYSYIVVSSISALSSIYDLKRNYQFQSHLIYNGELGEYKSQECPNITKNRYEILKQSLWMKQKDIPKICEAIQNCTDFIPQQTVKIAENVIFYTLLNYGKKNQQKFIEQIKILLKDEKKFKMKRYIKRQRSQWVDRIIFSFVSTPEELKDKCKRATFSYVITFDCTIQTIQYIKQILRRQKLQKRVYMYNATIKENAFNTIKQIVYSRQIQNKKEGDTQIWDYLKQRMDQVIKDGKFQIKFQLGPIDQITLYNGQKHLINFFQQKMGLQTININGKKQFTQKYMMKQKTRQQIIYGQCLVIKIRDYKEFKQLVELQNSDLEFVQDKYNNYLSKIKIIILDDRQSIQKIICDPQSFSQNEIINSQLKKIIRQDIISGKVIYINYNNKYRYQKIRQFLDVLFTPKIVLTVFKKKVLPNFHKAYDKLVQSNFKEISLTGSIVSKTDLLKQVFENETFKLNSKFKISFLRLQNSNKNLQEDLMLLQQTFLDPYSLLWRTGYQIHQVNKKNIQYFIQTFKTSIKSCLYKCKSYHLILVSQKQFEEMYIKKIQSCNTFIDLQIAVIYIFSLPHRLSNAIQLIFNYPRYTCLTPKIFTQFIFTLLSAFCNFEDQVMSIKRFAIDIQNLDISNFQSTKIYDRLDYTKDDIQSNNKSHSSTSKWQYPLKTGDILCNTSFFMCGKDQNYAQNINNSYIFLQFQDTPMVSQTHIKNYLNIQHFSFYRYGAKYLIAPYTQFQIKDIDIKPTGKVHIRLVAISDIKKGLVYKVFQANNMNQRQLYKVIEFGLQKISKINDEQIRFKQQNKTIKTGTLYQKAEYLSQQKERNELVNSIVQGSFYNKFIWAIRKQRYLTATCHLNRKQKQVKYSTSETQSLYFKKMLGVEKAMVYYHLCQYHKAIVQLIKVTIYLQNNQITKGDKWAIKKIKTYIQNIESLQEKRARYFNDDFPKKKIWKIQNQFIAKKQLQEQKQSVVNKIRMKQIKMRWQVGYQQNLQQFFMKNVTQNNLKDAESANNNTKIFQNQIKPAFGQLPGSFPPNSAYRILVDHDIKKYHLQELQQEEKAIGEFDKSQTNNNESWAEKAFEVKERVNWQVFFFDGRYLLAQKGKRFIVKQTGKYNL